MKDEHKAVYNQVREEFKPLYEKAVGVVGSRDCSKQIRVGHVAAAFETSSGQFFVGVNIDTACSLGFCAEHTAVGAFVTANLPDDYIIKCIAVHESGAVYPPCGRCRELISQLNPKNMDAEILVDNETIVILRDILPYSWLDAKAARKAAKLKAETQVQAITEVEAVVEKSNIETTMVEESTGKINVIEEKLN